MSEQLLQLGNCRPIVELPSSVCVAKCMGFFAGADRDLRGPQPAVHQVIESLGVQGSTVSSHKQAVHWVITTKATLATIEKVGVDSDNDLTSDRYHAILRPFPR